MRIIEIAPLENGAHRNQSYPGLIPNGWAIVPDDMEIPNTFPFVNIEVKDSDENGVPFVVSMTAGVMPEPTPIPEPEAETTVWDELDAAYQEGVNSAYDQ